MLSIVQYPDKRLSSPTTEVAFFDEALQRDIDDMIETHYAQTNCAALAANQLGLDRRITVIDFSEKKDELLILVNPYITHKEGETFQPEGCMSVNGIYEKVKRAEKISVDYQSREGEKRTLTADGFLAKCIQHEIDHLDGLVFIDRLSTTKKKLIHPKITKLLRAK
ncbi:MAG TPA: peptide deformylase [Gammaproteobacteria bacterium]|nr:peptide deformylase [Gammaproteobacteria bacterium]